MCGGVCGVCVCVCVCVVVCGVCVCVCVRLREVVCVCVCVLESCSFRRPGAWNRNAGTGFSTRGSCYSGIGYMDKCDKCSPSEVLPPPLSREP